MKTISLIFGCITLYLLQLCCVSGQSNNANATLYQATPSIYDKYIQADWDNDAPSGYVTKFENPLNASFFKDYVLVYMYTKENETSDRKELMNGHVCDLLDPNRDRYPKDNFLPRDIIHEIFSNHFGSCEIKSGREPIGTGRLVNLDPKNNPDLQFPESNHFELFVYILPNEKFFIDKPWDRYVFKVIYDIERIPEENGKSMSYYYCLNTQWNYYIVWRICTIAEFIETTVAGVGRKFIRIV